MIHLKISVGHALPALTLGWLERVDLNGLRHAATLGAEMPDPHADQLRLRRVERVLVTLRKRRKERSLDGTVPLALNESIAGFVEQAVRLREQSLALDANTLVSGKART